MSDFRISLFATAAMERLLLNSLAAMRRVGIDLAKVVVVHTDGISQYVLDEVAATGAEAEPLRVLTGDDAYKDPEVYTEYATPSFNEFMLLRTIALRELTERHDSILSVDLDIAWFRDPTRYIRKVLEIYPWTSQTEAVDLFPPRFCAGFFAFRNCKFSRELLDEVIRRTRADGIAKDDQEYLADILMNEPERMRAIFPLPEALFPNGLLTQAVLRRKEPQPVALTGRFDPFIYHANFTIGLENKMIVLEQAGAFDGPQLRREQTRQAPLADLRRPQDLREVENEHPATRDLIERLNRNLQEVEGDRGAKAEVIERLNRNLKEVEGDRRAKDDVIERLNRNLQEVEGDRRAKDDVIERLNRNLQEVEGDRRAKDDVIERLTRNLEEVEGDRRAKDDVIERLTRTYGR